MPGYSKTLLLKTESDVVISTRHGTEGGHACMDYIPGSVLFGAAVGGWLRSGRPFDPDLFFAGKLRFHNAYPSNAGEVPAKEMTLPTPLAYHQPKGDEVAVFNGVIKNLDPEANPDQPQLKQMRKGFIPLRQLGDAKLDVVATQHTSRMKTAIERGGYGRSKESQLFDYQAIMSGQSFLCCIEADETVDAGVFQNIIDILCQQGIRIGRSRSAEFGKVSVEAVDGAEPSPYSECEDGAVVLYLVSDLVLMREGNPVLLPNASDFGLPEHYALDLQRSFVRTRAFSPWVQYRDGYDIERQAISQGSVLTFTPGSGSSVTCHALVQQFASGWGLHRNEGCGRVLVNPPFLLTRDTLERAKQSDHRKNPSTEGNGSNDLPPAPSAFTRLLQVRHERKLLTLKAEPIANQWAEELLKMMERVRQEVDDAPGKTQWSNVRSIASSGGEPAVIAKALNELFHSARRQKMWTQAVYYGGSDAEQRGNRLSLAQFLLGSGATSPEKGKEDRPCEPWKEGWFPRKALAAKEEQAGHAWALLVALTASSLIRRLNQRETNNLQKELSHD